MKKLAFLFVTLAMILSFNPASLAQETKSDKKIAKADKKLAKAAAKDKSVKLTGWVKIEGDKALFENDKDKQTWTVANPDMLRAHDGMHVWVKATPHMDDRSILVEGVKDLKKSKQVRNKKTKG